jgi:hypothetical protein
VANSFPNLINRRRTIAATDDDMLTYITTTQPLGPLYSPVFAVPERYRDCFRPTMITDVTGQLDFEIAQNLSAIASVRPGRAAAAQPISAF